MCDIYHRLLKNVFKKHENLPVYPKWGLEVALTGSFKTNIMQEPLKLINVFSLKVEDAGLYTCLASSLAGEDGKNHWVRVQGDTSSSGVLLNLEEIYHVLSALLASSLTYTWDLMDGALCTFWSEKCCLHKSKTRLGLALAFSGYGHALLLCTPYDAYTIWGHFYVCFDLWHLDLCYIVQHLYPVSSFVLFVHARIKWLDKYTVLLRHIKLLRLML